MADVAVIGAGAIGLAVAWRAAARGFRVVVIDPEPGSGASHVAAGMLAPAGEAQFGEERLLALNLESARRWSGFVAELQAASDRDCHFRRCGSILVAPDADELRRLERELTLRRSLGLDAQALSGRDCRELEPGLAPSVRGGVLLEGDHQVDPRALVVALLIACQRSGVSVLRHHAAVDVRHGRCSGVTLDDGTRIDARQVVLAAGCWSAKVDGLPRGARPPVHPVKGQVLRLRQVSGEPLATRAIRGNSVYVLPRGDGRYVVGATSEDRGFDTSVTAAAMYELLRDARELLPDITELEVVEAGAGLRPGTPDNAPLIGTTDLDGLVIATGHHRNGILLTPITAEIVAAVLSGQPVPAVAEPFTPLRFATEAGVVA